MDLRRHGSVIMCHHGSLPSVPLDFCFIYLVIKLTIFLNTVAMKIFLIIEKVRRLKLLVENVCFTHLLCL